MAVTRPDGVSWARRSSNPFENLPDPTGRDRRIDGKKYDDDPRMDDQDWIEEIEKRAVVEEVEPAAKTELVQLPEHRPGPYRSAGEPYAAPFKMDWHKGATLTELQKARSTAGKTRLEQWREKRNGSAPGSAHTTPRALEDPLYRYYQTPQRSDLSATPWEPPQSEVGLQDDAFLDQLRCERAPALPFVLSATPSLPPPLSLSRFDT